MNLIECLSVAPIEYLQALATRLNANGKMHSKSDLMYQISIRLRNQEVLHELVDSLETESRVALRLIIYLGGIVGLTVPQFHHRLIQLNLVKTNLPEQIMFPLISQGIVFTSSPQHRIQRYLVPQDVRQLLIPILRTDIQRYLQSVMNITPKPFVSGWSIVRDTFSFLSYIRRNPPHLSRNKQLFHKTIHEIMHLFEVKGKVAVSKGDYPTRLRMIIYFCQSMQFIENTVDLAIATKHTSSWRVTETALDWFLLSRLDQLKSIYHSWSKNHLATFAYHSVILTILAGLPVNQWVTESSLLSAGNEILPDPGWEIEYQQGIQLILLPGLYHLGFIQRGENKTDGQAVTMVTELGKLILAGEGRITGKESELKTASTLLVTSKSSLDKPVLFIQPNFEMLVTSDCPLSTRWELELVADPIKPDAIITMQLSKRSLHRAFEAGYTAKKVIRLLQSLSQKPIPQNVIYSIEEWEMLYGRIYFAELFLLRCDNPTLAVELQSSPKFKPFIIGTVSPKDLIINKKEYTKLVEVLKEEGYLPKAKVIQ